MFNNFFHDFTAALWLALSIILIYLDGKVRESKNEEINRFYLDLFPVMFKWSLISLALNLVLGVFRAVAYYQYEYLPAAGQGQITALIIKHILLVAVVLLGIASSKKLHKNYTKLKRC